MAGGLTTKQQHRWKKSVDKSTRTALERAAARLKRAWNVDKKHPGSYPVSTFCVLAETNKLMEAGAKSSKGNLTAPSQAPEKFSDLVNEEVIAWAYERENRERYKEAL